jgi:hypothetical protein
VLARRDDDPKACARLDVDVRVHAALADEPELRQPLEEGSLDPRPLADEDEHLHIPQALGEGLDVLHVVVPDGDVVRRQLLEARQRAEGVEVVVQDGDLHRLAP